MLSTIFLWSEGSNSEILRYPGLVINSIQYSLVVGINRTKQENFILAPNAYNIRASAESLHETAPKYSFGIRTEVEKASVTPGWFYIRFYNQFFAFLFILAPNVYNVNVLDNSPRYSFGVKTNLEKPSETPG